MSSTNGWHKKRDGIVIVGGGLAGQRCAETLRRCGYGGPLKVVCAERHPPYDRPPLSKEMLAGSRPAESLAYKPAAWYDQQSVELLLGVGAETLLPHERRLLLTDGVSLGYTKLLIATGSRPRTIPLLAGYDNVSVLRDLDDAAQLRDVLPCRPRLAVIGAGFIGQEVAATARQLGAAVTMIEAAKCPLAGVLGTELGGWFTRLHQTEGVKVICGCAVESVEGAGRVRRLCLSTGEAVEVDHVLMGIGVEADTSWLAGSRVEARRGVPVDACGRTAIDGVLAAGDAAVTFDPLLGTHVAGSHWEAAGRQGARAARVMLELDPGVAPLTSFWTDQYGIRIQYLGRALVSDPVVIDGDPTGRDFTATFTRAGRPVAALLVGRPRALPAVRRLIEKGVT
jgi:3-phenylpropionate/trans-cinnamate dioxygenase ferredoxin reductase component